MSTITGVEAPHSYDGAPWRIGGGPADQSKKADESRSSALEGIRDSARQAMYAHGFIDRGTPRSEMIRDFLGIARDGMPTTGGENTQEGLFTTVSRVVRQNLDRILKSHGYFDPDTSRSEMIQLTLSLGPYADDPTDYDLTLSAGARIAEFCASLIQHDSDRARQTHRLNNQLDIHI